MKQFVRFEAQYYLDEQSFFTIKAIDPEKAQDYIDFMNATWSGGFYHPEYHVMTPEEAFAHIVAVIKDEQDSELEDSEEFIANALKELKECYGIDYKPNN